MPALPKNRCYKNELHATRWKEGSSPQDQPRQLFCIQKHVLLVSRVYCCPAVGHQILAHDPWLLRITASQVPCELPFVLFHKSGVTRDLLLYIFTHVQSGVKLTDIERLIAQMYSDGVLLNLDNNIVQALFNEQRCINLMNFCACSTNIGFWHTSPTSQLNVLRDVNIHYTCKLGFLRMF